MRAYESRPALTPIGGILLFQEAFGVNDYIRRVADRFAAEGYHVIAPELFHRNAPPGFEAPYTDYELARPHHEALKDVELEADIFAVYEWMKTEGGVQKISSVGFCMGGRVSFIANSALQLHRAISFYGGGIDLIASRAATLQAPMLFLWGGKDARITPDKRQVTREALDAANASYVDTVFADAGHGFFCDARASFDQRSSDLAWPLALAFLK